MAVAEAEIKTGLRMTEDEFKRLPKDGRKYELVDGRLTEVPTSFRHDEIGAIIIALLMPYVRGRGSMATGQAGFYMAGGNIRVPDVAFMRKERLPGGKAPDTFGNGAPDLCVEIISPSENTPDMTRKIEEYFASGAVQVWRVFPDTQQMVVFTSPTEARTLGADDTLDGGDLFPGFSCSVAEVLTMD